MCLGLFYDDNIKQFYQLQCTIYFRLRFDDTRVRVYPWRVPTGDAKMAAGRQMTVAESRLWGGVGGVFRGGQDGGPVGFTNYWLDNYFDINLVQIAQ